MTKSMENIKPGSEAGFLTSARDLTTIAAIYLYFGGWLYIYDYYNYFGLSIKQVDMDFYYFLVYSLNVILFYFKYWYFTVAAIGVAIFAATKLRQAWVMYVICILLLVSVYYCSDRAAIAAARNDFAYHGSHLKKIKLVLKRETPLVKGNPGDKAKDTLKSLRPDDPVTREFVSYNQQNGLKLLVATKDEYFLIVTNKNITKENADQYPVEVFSIKKENVNLAKLDN